MTVHKLYINCNLIPERTISTTTKSTTTTTTTTTKQTEFEIMIDVREMKSVFIWSGSQEVVATTISSLDSKRRSSKWP